MGQPFFELALQLVVAVLTESVPVPIRFAEADLGKSGEFLLTFSAHKIQTHISERQSEPSSVIFVSEMF